jgi:uncharacterized protein YjiS (DUF1127 family)
MAFHPYELVVHIDLLVARQRLEHGLRNLIRRLNDLRRMRRSMVELRGLDDRSLEDIGLTQADRIAAH